MARKNYSVLVDDFDGSDAEETVTFGLDGSTYEIDLNTENASALRDAMAGYVGHARKVGGRRGAPARKTSAASDSGTTAAEIRQWAKAAGHDVPERGRVSAEVRSAYEAAH